MNRAVDSVKKAEDTVISGTYSVAGMDQNESLVKAAATATKLVNTYKTTAVKTAALIGTLPAVAVVSKIHYSKSKYTLDKHAFDNIDINKLDLSKAKKPRQELAAGLRNKKISGEEIVGRINVNDLLVKHKHVYNKPMKQYKAKLLYKDFQLSPGATLKEISKRKRDILFENIIDKRGTNNIVKVGIRVFNRGKIKNVNRSVLGTSVRSTVAKYKLDNKLYKDIQAVKEAHKELARLNTATKVLVIKFRNNAMNFQTYNDKYAVLFDKKQAQREIIGSKNIKKLQKRLQKNYNRIINTYRPSLLKRYTRFARRASIKLIKQTATETIKSTVNVASSLAKSTAKNGGTGGEAIMMAVNSASKIQTASKITVSTAKGTYKFAKTGVKTSIKTVRAVRHPVRTTKMMKAKIKNKLNKIKDSFNKTKKAILSLHKMVNPATITIAGALLLIIMLSNLLTLAAGITDEVEEYGYDLNNDIYTDIALYITKQDAELKTIVDQMKSGTSDKEKTFNKLKKLVGFDETKSESENGIEVEYAEGDYNYGIHTTPWYIGTYVDDAYNGEIKPEYYVPGDVWDKSTIDKWQVNSDYAMLSDLKSYYDFMGISLGDIPEEELVEMQVETYEPLVKLWQINNKVHQKITYYQTEKIKIEVPVYEKVNVTQNESIGRPVWTTYNGAGGYECIYHESHMIPIQFITGPDEEKVPMSYIKMYKDYHDDDGDGICDYFMDLTDFFFEEEDGEWNYWENVNQDTQFYIVGIMRYSEKPEIWAIGKLKDGYVMDAYREKDSPNFDNADVEIVGFVQQGQYELYMGEEAIVSHYWEETENTKEVETTYHHYGYKSNVTLKPTNARAYLDESIQDVDDDDNFPPKPENKSVEAYVKENRGYFIKFSMALSKGVTIDEVDSLLTKTEKAFISYFENNKLSNTPLFLVFYALNKEEIDKEAIRIMVYDKQQQYEIVREFGSNITTRFINNITDYVMIPKARYGYKVGEYYDWPYQYIQFELPKFKDSTAPTTIYSPCSGMLYYDYDHNSCTIEYEDASNPEFKIRFEIEMNSLILYPSLKQKLEKSDGKIYVYEREPLGTCSFSFIDIGVFRPGDDTRVTLDEPSVYIDDECLTHYALKNKVYDEKVDELILYFEERLNYFWQDNYKSDEYPEKYNDLLGYNEVSFIYKALAEHGYLDKKTDKEYGDMSKFKEALNGKMINVSELKDGDVVILSDGRCGYVADADTRLMIHCKNGYLVKYEYFGDLQDSEITAYRVIIDEKVEKDEEEKNESEEEKASAE